MLCTAATVKQIIRNDFELHTCKKDIFDSNRDKNNHSVVIKDTKVRNTTWLFSTVKNKLLMTP